jgi:hypothetical protein
MKSTILAVFLSLIAAGCALGQSDVATFKVEARSAFVWGEDVSSGAKSWTVKDPLTGTETLKLSHEGVEVSSRMGFEKLHREDAAELIAFTTTIVNNTEAKLEVEAAGVTVDGHLASLLSVNSSRKSQKKEPKTRTNMVESGKLYCFSSGFLSSENFLSRVDAPSLWVVNPRATLTVSGVIWDPRHGSMLCSAEGCFPKGSLRYAIRVGGHEYIFSWAGRSIVNCGR